MPYSWAWLTDGVVLSASTKAGRDGIAALLDRPAQALVAFDYDGTLAPIVADPLQAYPHPRVVPALADLSRHVGLVAIITGRPAGLAVDLARLAGVAGLDRLVILGHYGLERWEAGSGKVQSAALPAGLDAVRRALPRLLDSLGAGRADIEDKGLSVAVHVRRLDDPVGMFAAVKGPLRELAEQHGLAAEPGKMVVELRPRGMDKGVALRRLVTEVRATVVAFTGDDLGDLSAFAEVERLRAEGFDGLRICSGSDEVTALRQQADLVVDGPAGVVQWIEELVDQLDRRRPVW
ncbi:MAG: trehalose-phosphatase [Nocardioidaceae bacterium]|nr:trehalose-phosphatase [Nocardioidaceae bacterium]